jgi:hypothetical protein
LVGVHERLEEMEMNLRGIVLGLVALCVCLTFAGSADAFWGSRGSHGSHGSNGSFGSHGSHGGHGGHHGCCDDCGCNDDCGCEGCGHEEVSDCGCGGEESHEVEVKEEAPAAPQEATEEQPSA